MSRALVAGEVGVVVHVYESGLAPDVGFEETDGQTIAVESLDATAEGH
jgi:hypothetical protein